MSGWFGGSLVINFDWALLCRYDQRHEAEAHGRDLHEEEGWGVSRLRPGGGGSP